MITVYDMSSWDQLEREAGPRSGGGWRLPGYGEGAPVPLVEPRLALVAEERLARREAVPCEIVHAALRTLED